ncbi:4'-phosphopantetheinyl transferase family protein [Paenibacillus apiarius]|uniref:4'-phosphopantetheinyl transferase family protein n=1 Tax=Paenibacillus apiarius TaxID=46240 RepID=UPI003B3A8D82
MVEIYAVNINDPIENLLYNRLYSCISDEKRERLIKFQKVEDAKRTLYGNLLVRYLACTKLNLANEKLRFARNEFWKPYLQNNIMFKLNISHSGAWVVCAIADTEVGIDVEEIKPIDFSVSQCFFSKREHQQLMMQREELRLAYFYNLWTMKESYIKCIGKGLSIPLNSFTVC